ncbi:hypothetical protein [Nonomuraea glycinis]|uniref:hypothetical protein n=1 Tax=Nonomuraea glycinis TaxID=2047744 RepID=UPI0033A4EF8A
MDRRLVPRRSVLGTGAVAIGGAIAAPGAAATPASETSATVPQGDLILHNGKTW